MSISAKAEIDIAAPLERVWAVMLDMGAYSAWNPFIVNVERAPATIEIGSLLHLHVRWKNGGKARSTEVVTRLLPPSQGRAELAYRFTGWLDTLGLVRAERVQTLEALPSGLIRYWTEDAFRGLLTAFVPLRDVQDGFERHAKALKERAESKAV